MPSNIMCQGICRHCDNQVWTLYLVYGCAYTTQGDIFLTLTLVLILAYSHQQGFGNEITRDILVCHILSLTWRRWVHEWQLRWDSARPVPLRCPNCPAEVRFPEPREHIVEWDSGVALVATHMHTLEAQLCGIGAHCSHQRLSRQSADSNCEDSIDFRILKHIDKVAIPSDPLCDKSGGSSRYPTN